MIGSKSTDKLVVVASMVENLPNKDRVKSINVVWKVIDLNGEDMPVPFINIEYYDGKESEFIEPEDDKDEAIIL